MLRLREINEKRKNSLKYYSYHLIKLINLVDPNQEEVALEAVKVVLEVVEAQLKKIMCLQDNKNRGKFR